MMIFRDRRAAARQLAALLRQREFIEPIVLGIPRGGVVLSAEIARELSAVHGVIVARKLGAQHQPELAIGAISSSGVAYIDDALVEMTGTTDRYLESVMERERAEAARRESQFDGQKRPPVRGRTVIIVDDGVATGATSIAAIRAMKAEGAGKVVFAVPVGPPSTIARLRDEADDVICLFVELNFFSVGQFYRDFGPVENAEVKRILENYERQRERV